jgi:hypothetical protein
MTYRQGVPLLRHALFFTVFLFFIAQALQAGLQHN